MGALAFWKAVVRDRSNLLERVIATFEENRVSYCVIGGVGVNAYAEPMVTQDLDIVVGTADLERTRELLIGSFRVEEFEHSINVRDDDSQLQVQLQKDPDMSHVIARAQTFEVLGMRIPVAHPEDLVRLKIRAATDSARRPGKRGKDILDIGRLVNAFPELMSEVPDSLRPRIEELLDER